MKKKLVIIFLFLYLSASVYGTELKTLVVYFSYGGNTEALAEKIAEITDADLFRIKTLKIYPPDFRDCFTIAKLEQDRKFRPELEAYPDLSQYDMIYIGYPIWWSDMPMAIYSFIENADLSGKTLIPFCTHGGGGILDTENTISKLCPHSHVKQGFSTRGSYAYDKYTLDALKHWIRLNNFH